MMLEQIQAHRYYKPVSELDAYCRAEGLDALYIRSTFKRERRQLFFKKTARIAARIFGRWMAPERSTRFLNARY